MKNVQPRKLHRIYHLLGLLWLDGIDWSSAPKIHGFLQSPRLPNPTIPKLACALCAPCSRMCLLQGVGCTPRCWLGLLGLRRCAAVICVANCLLQGVGSTVDSRSTSQGPNRFGIKLFKNLHEQGGILQLLIKAPHLLKLLHITSFYSTSNFRPPYKSILYTPYTQRNYFYASSPHNPLELSPKSTCPAQAVQPPRPTDSQRSRRVRLNPPSASPSRRRLEHREDRSREGSIVPGDVRAAVRAVVATLQPPLRFGGR